MCACNTRSNHICALDRFIRDAFPDTPALPSLQSSYVLAVHFRVRSMLRVDAITTFSPTGWCEKKARPRSPFRAKLSQAALFRCAKKKAPAEFSLSNASKSTLNQGGQGAFFTHQPVSIFFVLRRFSTSCFLCDFARAGAKHNTSASIGTDNIGHYCRPYDKYSY
jgi:hypothetical protein